MKITKKQLVSLIRESMYNTNTLQRIKKMWSPWPGAFESFKKSVMEAMNEGAIESDPPVSEEQLQDWIQEWAFGIDPSVNAPAYFDTSVAGYRWVWPNAWVQVEDPNWCPPFAQKWSRALYASMYGDEAAEFHYGKEDEEDE